MKSTWIIYLIHGRFAVNAVDVQKVKYENYNYFQKHVLNPTHDFESYAEFL